MKLIVVVDDNWAIGKGNKLLYNLPYDLKNNFRKETKGKVVIVGSNTLLSFPNSRPLPHRTNIVLCNTGEVFADCIMADSLTTLKDIICNYDKDDVFVCGGATVYRLLLPYCDGAIITKVNATTIDADSFFPNVDLLPNWQLQRQSFPIQDNGYTITINHYRNDSPKQL
ncbi:MAG: dihydrofolate reductase [Clostridia bacterium]|nr:dihydrofolate reductase [Clostridia bacterium]